MRKVFVSIVGYQHYFGYEVFQVGESVLFSKEPNNRYDSDAICVRSEPYGLVGYVANNSNTVLLGTLRASRIYEFVNNDFFGKVVYASFDNVVCEIEIRNLPVQICKVENDNFSCAMEIKGGFVQFNNFGITKEDVLTFCVTIETKTVQMTKELMCNKKDILDFCNGLSIISHSVGEIQIELSGDFKMKFSSDEKGKIPIMICINESRENNTLYVQTNATILGKFAEKLNEIAQNIL